MSDKQNIARNEGFTQVCVWPGCVLEPEEVDKFADLMAEHFHGVRVQFLEQITTGPDTDEHGNPIEDTGGRNDIFFAVHDEDSGKFSLPRLAAGIRWVEDVLDPGNYRSRIYPKRVHEYCSW